MARDVLTVQDIIRDGITIVYAAGDALGHSFNNAGENIFIHVKNTNASPINVTILNPSVLDGEDVPDKVIAVGATTGDEMIGPFPKTLYEQLDVDSEDVRSILIDLSAVTDVTIAAEWFAADGVVDTGNDDLNTGDLLVWNVTAIHSGTAPNGLSCMSVFRKP